VSNEAILLLCQMKRFFFYAKWTIQWIYKCQMGRFDGFISVKWGDYSFMLNGRFNEFISVKWGDLVDF